MEAHIVMINPLVEYKKASSLEWSEIAKKAGITVQCLFSLRRKDVSDFGLVRLETAVRLKDKLGIDLIHYVK